jgi:hypothetical protein
VRDGAVKLRFYRLDGEGNHMVNVEYVRVDRQIAEVAKAAIEGENGAAVDGLKDSSAPLASTA